MESWKKLLQYAGIPQSAVWKVDGTDSGLIAIDPQHDAAITAAVAVMPTYKRWWQREYRVSETFLNHTSASAAIVLHQGPITGSSDPKTFPTSYRVGSEVDYRIRSGPLAFGVRTRAVTTKGTYSVQTDPNGYAFIASGPGQQSSIEAMAWFEETFGPTMIGPDVELREVNISAGAGTNQQQPSNLRSRSGDAAVNVVAPVLPRTRVGWRLIYGPAAVTRAEYYPGGIYWAALTNADLAARLVDVRDATPDRNQKARLDARISILQAAPEDVLVLAKFPGVNVYRLCPDTRAHASEIIDLSGVQEGVDIGAMNSRIGLELVGVARGALEIPIEPTGLAAELTALPPGALELTLTSAGLGVPGITDPIDPADAARAIDVLRLTGKTVTIAWDALEPDVVARRGIELRDYAARPVPPGGYTVDVNADLGGVGTAYVAALSKESSASDITTARGLLGSGQVDAMIEENI